MNQMFSVSSSLSVDRDNKGKWLEVYRLADALLVMFETWKKTPVENLQGDEFEAARKLLSFHMASSGHHIDAVLTATTQDQLFEILNEFLSVCKSRYGA